MLVSVVSPKMINSRFSVRKERQRPTETSRISKLKHNLNEHTNVSEKRVKLKSAKNCVVKWSIVYSQTHTHAYNCGRSYQTHRSPWKNHYCFSFTEPHGLWTNDTPNDDLMRCLCSTATKRKVTSASSCAPQANLRTRTRTNENFILNYDRTYLLIVRSQCAIRIIMNSYV